MVLMVRGGTTEDPHEAALMAWMAASVRPLIRVMLLLQVVALSLGILVIVLAVSTGSRRDVPYLLYVIASMPLAAGLMWFYLALWRRLPEVERRHAVIAQRPGQGSNRL